MMHHVRAAAIAVIVAVMGAPALAGGEDLRVATMNQYLGADLGPLLSATTPDAFFAAVEATLAQIAANDFPRRARAQARQIAERQPHLVGLQEVFRLTLDGATGAPPFRDHLSDLLDALAELGANYYVAAEVVNVDVAIPLPSGGALGVRDRDVILARGDVPAVPLALPGCLFPSADGCNYAVAAGFATPLGPLTLPRGFVVVEAMAAGQNVRFANTHLEVAGLPPFFQASQAAELIARLSALPNPAGAPLLIVGDLNSSPTDPSPAAPYHQLAAAGYIDTWLLVPGNRPSFTCCQASDLRNRRSTLSDRIDLIFVNTLPARVQANALGNERAPGGIWPSDHAPVFGRVGMEP